MCRGLSERYYDERTHTGSRARRHRPSSGMAGVIGRVLAAWLLMTTEPKSVTKLRTGRTLDLRPMAVAVPIYIALIAGAEVAVARWGAVVGIVAHALIMIVLTNHFIIGSQAPARVKANPNASFWFIDILPILALAPLLRFASLSLTLRDFPPIYAYAIAGTPLLLAVLLTVRLLGLSPNDLGFSLPPSVLHLLVALSGVPLGLLGCLILRPSPVSATFDWYETVISSLVLLILVAFPEEVIFRGMLQRTVSELFGPSGLLLSSLLFAAMHVSSRSLVYVVFSGSVGLLFGWYVMRTGSIWGAVLGHGLLITGLILVWPFVLR